MDAYRRNVQLKRRCSGLESRGRQLNRKITHPGPEPVRLSPIKRMQIRRETCPVIEVIIVSRSPRACHRVLFSLSLSSDGEERRDFFSFPSKEPKQPRHSFSSLVNARIQLLSFTIYNRGRRILYLYLSGRSFRDNFFFGITRECLRRGSISGPISHYGLGNYN